jgi:hypothetical protein
LAASVKFAATATFVCAAFALGIAAKVAMHAAAPSAVTIADSERKLFIKCSPHRFDGETPHLLHVGGRKSFRASSPDGLNA